MHETELKFQIPLARRAAVRRAVATRTATRQRLQAAYFDTPDRDLARAGVALRLRKEGRHWVQTLKAADRSAMQRLEHNAPVAPVRGQALLPDVSLHAGTPAGARLDAVLAGLPPPQWTQLYATDIRRTARRSRAHGAGVELALDEGVIQAGAQRLAVHEIEIELKAGPPAGLLRTAADWVARHGLWLDVRSKAERGDRLARGVDLPQAVRAVAPRWPADADPDQALRAMVAAALAQVLGNAAEVADEHFGSEHVHQLRVGLRRLRSLLRELPDWAAGIDPGWEPTLAQAFAGLGAARDRDALAASWQRDLLAAGAPLVSLPAPADAPPPGAVVRDPAFQQLLLALLGFASADRAASVADSGAASAPVTAVQALRAQADATLARLHRRAARDARQFTRLDEAQRHRLRKRLKRLRYVAEALAPLYARKRMAPYLASLRRAQDALGTANDLGVALGLYEAAVGSDARAWFAVGWLRAQWPAALATSAKTLGRWADSRRFWRKA